VVEVLKVSSKSNPNSVAGALAGVLRQTGAVEVQVVGAGALNQAIKAIAIARGFVAPSNLDLVCIPTFADILIDGQGRTAIRLAVEDRTRRKPSDLAPAADVRVPAVPPLAVPPPAVEPLAAVASTTNGTTVGLAVDPDVSTTIAAYQAPAASTATVLT
jgi:stage V sporulation protein S